MANGRRPLDLTKRGYDSLTEVLLDAGRPRTAPGWCQVIQEIALGEAIRTAFDLE